MYAVRMPTGEFLDLFPGTNFQFELQNRVFATSDTSVLPGSFTFPADLPLTPRNRALLGFPELITSAAVITEVPDVWIYAFGQPMFVGNMTVKEAGDRIRISIIANPMKDLKEVELRSIDTEGTRAIGADDAAVQAHMLDTASDPESYDYAFFPVWGDNFGAAQVPTAGLYPKTFQNFYNDEFTTDSALITPFVKLQYVLQQIFVGLDYTFVNEWQNTAELRRLYLYNQVCIRIVDAGSAVLPSEIDLTKHLWAGKATDLVKEIMALFALGIFTNPFHRTIRLVPLRDVARRSARYDWTNYQQAGHTISYDPSAVFGKFCYPQKGGTAVPIGDDVDLPEIATFEDLIADLATYADGYYYITMSEFVVEVYGGGTAWRSIGWKRRCITYAPEPVFEPKITPMFMIDFDVVGMNVLNYEGDPTYTRVEDGATVTHQADTARHIMFYRGFQGDNGFDPGNEFPWANNDLLDPQGDLTAQITGDSVFDADAVYSLKWDGDAGMYAQWWGAWHQALYAGKHVSKKFVLPIGEVTSFQFDEKIRVDNMDYFVKTLRIQRLLNTPHGQRFEVDAQLVSVI